MKYQKRWDFELSLSLDDKPKKNKNKNIYKNIELDYTPYQFKIKKLDILFDQSVLYIYFLFIKNFTKIYPFIPSINSSINIYRKYFYLFVYDLIVIDPDSLYKILYKIFYIKNFTIDPLYIIECIKKSKKLYIFNSNSFDFFFSKLNSKIILDEDFILRIPYYYMVFLGSYLEYFRQFKYHEYLSGRFFKKPNIKDGLLWFPEEFNPVQKFYKNLFNNKFLYYENLNFNFQIDSLPDTIFFEDNFETEFQINLDYNYILKKNNSYFFDFSTLQLFNIWSVKKYKEYLRIYIYRMAYKGIIDYRYYFRDFPRKILDSLDLLYFKLINLCKYDLWAFAASYLIKEKYRYINKDLAFNLPSIIYNNLDSIIEERQFIENPCSIIMDYLGILFYKYISVVDMESRYTDIEETGFNDFIEMWEQISLCLTFRFTEINLFSTIYSSPELLSHIYIYKQRYLEKTSWIIFSQFIDNSPCNYTFFKIDFILNYIYIPFNDLFLMNSIELLNMIKNIYYYHLYNFYNDIAIKIIFFINTFCKPYFYLQKNMYNNRLKYYVNFHILHLKKIKNYYIFYQSHKMNYSIDEDIIRTKWIFYSHYHYREWAIFNEQNPNINYKHDEFAIRDYECTSNEAIDLLSIEKKFITNITSEFNHLSEYLDWLFYDYILHDCFNEINDCLMIPEFIVVDKNYHEYYIENYVDYEGLFKSIRNYEKNNFGYTPWFNREHFYKINFKKQI